MAERRTSTLLGFAIAASAAVVPVLLLVLVVADFVRPLDPLAQAARDRHVSVRLVAALKTFEQAIVRRDRVRVGPPTALLLLDRVPECRSAWDGHESALDRARSLFVRSGAPAPSPAQRLASRLADLDADLARFSGGANRRVSEPVGFDSARWFEAVELTLKSPIEAPDYPGHKFTVQCADLATAAAMLARSDGRMLATLSWRGTEVERVTSHWRPEQFVEISARQIARSNPWRGLPGCVFMGDSRAGAQAHVYFVTAARAAESQLCTRPEMHGDAEERNGTALPLGIALSIWLDAIL